MNHKPLSLFMMFTACVFCYLFLPIIAQEEPQLKSSSIHEEMPISRMTNHNEVHPLRSQFQSQHREKIKDVLNDRFPGFRVFRIEEKIYDGSFALVFTLFDPLSKSFTSKKELVLNQIVVHRNGKVVLEDSHRVPVNQLPARVLKSFKESSLKDVPGKIAWNVKQEIGKSRLFTVGLHRKDKTGSHYSSFSESGELVNSDDLLRSDKK